MNETITIRELMLVCASIGLFSIVLGVVVAVYQAWRDRDEPERRWDQYGLPHLIEGECPKMPPVKPPAPPSPPEPRN